MDSKQVVLSCPYGDRDGELRLAFSAILRAEQRQREIEVVTLQKAPELMSAMNQGWLEVSRMALLVDQQLLAAKKRADKRRAVVLLDVVPAELERRGIEKSNKEVRDAILTQDAELELLTDRVARIEAILELLKVKARGFDNCFNAVRKILGTPALINAPKPTPNNGPVPAGFRRDDRATVD